MKTHKKIAVAFGAALVATTGHSAFAQDDYIKSLITPESYAEFGVIGAIDETKRAGMYSGLDQWPAFPIVNGEYVRRDDATGTWYRAQANDLGLDSRGLRLEYEHQGDVKYWLNFSQIPKTNPLDVYTGLSGIDSNDQVVSGTTPRNVELSTDRYDTQVGFRKYLGHHLDANVSYRAEYKNGRRQFGSGFGTDFLIDPIDQWTHEIDAKLNYTTEKLQLTGGFLGSFFENKHTILNNDGGSPQLALPPDNQAYNFYLNGGYSFTPTTRGSFKFAYNLMTQTDDFFIGQAAFASNHQTNLGGQVHNYLGQAGVSSRPTKDLTLRAKLRYEGRHDDTVVEQYVPNSRDRNGRNIPMSRETITANGEATYRLPQDYRLTGGVKYEYWDRTYPPLRQSSWRARTDEYSGRAQLSKRLTESLGGSVAYVYSVRGGSSFLNANNLPTVEDVIDPIHWGDRERQQWRLHLDWAATNKLSVQALVDGSLDTYHSDERRLGPENGMSHNAAIDAAYQLNRDWSLTAFVSRNEITREQKQDDESGNVRGPWTADLRNIGYAGGVGVRGQATSRLKLGADMQYSYDKSESELKGADPTIVDLPDVAYKQFDFKMFAAYDISDRGRVKFNYVFSHIDAGDWTYQFNVYQDGTIIRIPEQENAHFIGLSYVYRW